MRKGFWGRHGANIASRYEQFYGEKSFGSPKKRFLREFNVFLQPFYQKRIKAMFIRGKYKFLSK